MKTSHDPATRISPDAEREKTRPVASPAAAGGAAPAASACIAAPSGRMTHVSNSAKVRKSRSGKPRATDFVLPACVCNDFRMAARPQPALDDVDRDIVRLLQRDGRTSN